MEINNKKNHLSRILFFFIMFLFAMGLAMNVPFCNNYNFYELLDKTTVIETRTISESIVSNEDGYDTTNLKLSFLIKNNSHTKVITKNICPIPIIAAIPKGLSLLLFLVLALLFYFLISFTLLPDEWTLINQKVRLDD